MGASLGKSENTATNQGSFNQGLNPYQLPSMQNLWRSAGGLFGQTNRQLGNQIPSVMRQNRNVARDTRSAFRDQLGGGIYDDMDLVGMYQNALQGGGAEQDINEMIMGGAGNNYVDAMQDQLRANAYDNLMDANRSLDARAAAYGGVGSSPYGLALAKNAEQSQRDLLDAQTRLGYETFDRDLDRKLGIARRADEFDANRLASTERLLGARDAAVRNGLAFGQNQQGLNMGRLAPAMVPWQAMNQWAGVMTPIMQSTGSQTGSASGDSKSLGASK